MSLSSVGADAWSRVCNWTDMCELFELIRSVSLRRCTDNPWTRVGDRTQLDGAVPGFPVG